MVIKIIVSLWRMKIKRLKIWMLRIFMLHRGEIAEAIDNMNTAILFGDYPYLSMEYKQGFLDALIMVYYGDKNNSYMMEEED
jgi:hypothetical protein